jgi:MFS transporter, DHA1 family, multidrug resistance protein
MVAVQFTMSAALSMMSPFLPLFIIQLGTKRPDLVDVWSGVISSSNFFIAAIVSPFWGSLADRYGRKAMVVRTTTTITIFTALMGFSQNVWELFALRGLMGAFSGFSASAIALVGTVVPEDSLGYALGWLSTGQLLGGLLGPLMGGFLAGVIGNYRVVFFCTSAISALAVLLTLFGVREQFVPPDRTVARPSIWKQIVSLRTLPGLGAMFVVLLLAQFATRAVQPVLTLFVRELVGPTPYLAILAGAAFSIVGVADLVASPFLGKRSDRLGYKRVLSISLLGAAVFNLPQAFVHSIWAFLAAQFGLGIFIGGIIPTANALVGRLAPPERRGQVYGLTASASFLGNSLGPLTGGLVAAKFGIRSMFLVTATLLLVTLAWVRRTVREPERSA